MSPKCKRGQEPRTVKTILKKNVGGLQFPISKPTTKPWQSKRRGASTRTDIRPNRTELRPEINPHMCGYTGVQDYPTKTGKSFSTWHWDNWAATCKRMKSDLYLTAYTTSNSKRNIDLNAKAKTINTLRILRWHQKQEQQKKRNINCTSLKLKLLCFQGSHQESKKITHRMGENIW